MQIFKAMLLSLFVLVLIGCMSKAALQAAQDVIGRYSLVNEESCRRLCWYRQLCTSYSYVTASMTTSESLTPRQNCILYADSGTNTRFAANETTRKFHLASNSQIVNGCKSRPCGDKEVCAPTSSISLPTSPASASHMCLPLPSKCGDLQPVPNGNVTVFGTYQDDVSEVTCNVGYVASPRGVSLAQRCLITSVWSTLEGTCKQSKFWKMEQAFVEEIPWAPTEHSKMCVKGVFNDTSQITVNLKQTSRQRIIHMAFRYEADKVIWNVRNEGNWQPELERYLGPMPLVPGDSLNLTLHVQNDRLQYTLNEAHVYTIPLLGVNNNTDGVNITDISMLVIKGPVSLTFINLVEGC